MPFLIHLMTDLENVAALHNTFCCEIKLDVVYAYYQITQIVLTISRLN